MVWWTTAVTLAAGLAAWGAGYWEVFAGLGAPALAVAGSWAVMTRAWASSPATLLPVMLRIFASKSVFYLAYVAVVLKKTEARPEPFVAGLVAGFIVLNFVQAWALKRLMEGPQGLGK
ncbi:MAG: hypothetical protein AMXMBFR57_22640 [Acidimicrobiia bacterium]|jgi:hypothetical protein